MREGGGVHLEADSRQPAQRLAVEGDLLGHLLGAADEQRPLRPALGVEVGTGDGRPSAFLATEAMALAQPGKKSSAAALVVAAT